MLTDIKAAADPVNLERSVKEDIKCRKVRGIYARGVVVSLRPSNLSAHTATVNRTVLHVNLTVDRVAIRRCGVFGLGTLTHQVPFLHAHPNAR